MRKLSDFRKGVASTFEARPSLASGKPGPNGPQGEGKPPTFADLGARIGEDNETLRNLLIDTGHHMSALDELKGTFEKLVEPISQTLRTLEHEKSDNASLRDALADVRASQDTLRGEFQALGRKSAELESDNARLRRELTVLQDNARELEGSKADLTRAVVAARETIATLEDQLGHETAGSRALGEENKILAEHASVGDKRIVELEAAAALAREKVSLLETEKGSLQTSLDQTLAETTRLSRRLAESETALTAARARLEQLERSLAASEEDRKKLSAACDEANERRQSECYAVNLKLDAMRSRAATAEKLLAEVRQSVVGRTEEIRATERRVVDSAVALSASEKKNERLAAVRETQGRQLKELEQSHAALLERSNGLAETLKARETALAHAEDRVKSLTNRIEQLELDTAANRAKAEQQIAELNATIQRERMDRAVSEGALETTRRDYARLQRELLTERAARRRNPEVEFSEPGKATNGKAAVHPGNPVEAKLSGAETEPGAAR